MHPVTALTVERVSPSSLIEHPANARRGDVEVIKESIAAHGQFVPLVAQRSTRHVIKGNHTLRAAVELGLESVDVVFLDVDDDQALRIMLIDNRISDLGTYEEQSLTALLAGLSDLAGTGYEPGDLDARLASLVNDAADASWEERDARSILLTYPVDEHAAVVANLDRHAARLGLDSYSDVVLALIKQELPKCN
jgi:ParB-like chromosome segregation protein Spo0J